MRLRGAPPAGAPAMSYVNSPTGSIIGVVRGPKGDRGFAFAGLTPALDGTAVQGLVESETGVVPAGDPVPVSIAWNSTVTHGSDNTVARPPVSVAVIWIGSVEPVNAIDGDIWMDTAGTAPGITTTVLNSLSKGMPVLQQLTATGTTPLIWSVESGSLPSGVVLSSAGELSGNPTNEGQAYDFTVQAWNGYGSDTAEYTGTVGAPVAPTIVTTSLGGTPTAGTPYSQPLAATGSIPLTWSINAGTIPNGLSINTSTGTISGTPTTDGAYDFTVRATNSVGYDDQRFTGTINGSVPVISTATLNAISQGAVFSQIPAVTGSAPITWSINAGSLPSGLSLNTSTGEISGTPTTFGAYDFTVRATNAYGYDDQQYTGTVASATPVITKTTFGDLYRAVAFSDTAVATGATPFTWSVVAGTLPAGLSLDTSTGVLSGTPTTVAAYDFTVRATNTYGTNDKEFTGNVLESTPSITETALGSMHATLPFTQTMHATGYAPFTWSVSAGTLPAGLSLDTSTGVLSGTPTAAGAYDFTVRATNSVDFGEQHFTGSVNTHVALQVDASGGKSGLSTAGSPYAWTQTVGADGATVYVDFFSDRPNTLSAVTCNGTAMDHMDTVTCTTGGTGSSAHAFITRYKLAGVAAGTASLSITPSVAAWCQASSVSVLGVASEGALQSVANAIPSTASQAATCSAGQIVLQSFGFGWDGSNLVTNAVAASGGTNIRKTNNAYSGITTSYANAAVTFGITLTHLGYWGGIAHTLIPE